MTAARLPGEFVSGEKIAYQFGKVSDGNADGRTSVSLGLNGDARVLVRYRRRLPGQPQPQPPVGGNETLSAGSAHGVCDVHRRDRKKKPISGSHRGFTGVMIGGARLHVVTPKPGTPGY